MEAKTETPAPKKKNRLMGILPYVVVLVLGAGGGYGAFTFLGGHAAGGEEAASAEGEGEAAKSEEGEGAKEEGGAKPVSNIINLGVFTVNLRGSGGGRILRMEVQLDSGGSVSSDVEARTPQLRDTVITAVSDYTWAELEGVDGKTRLRDELLARLNGAASPLVIDRLYFTQFVVQ